MQTIDKSSKFKNVLGVYATPFANTKVVVYDSLNYDIICMSGENLYFYSSSHYSFLPSLSNFGDYYHYDGVNNCRSIREYSAKTSDKQKESFEISNHVNKMLLETMDENEYIYESLISVISSNSLVGE